MRSTTWVVNSIIEHWGVNGIGSKHWGYSIFSLIFMHYAHKM